MKIKFYLLVIVLAAMFSVEAGAKDYFVSSPDKTIQVKVQVGELVNWSATLDGEPLMDDSPVAMQLAGEILCAGPKVVKAVSKEINETIKAVVPYKFSTIYDRCNELLLTFKGNYALRFRVYNDGLAWRMEMNRKGELVVLDEKCGFNFAGACNVLFPEEESFISHYERHYLNTSLVSIREKQFCSLPVLVTNQKGIQIAVTETGQSDYPAMFLKGTGKNGLQSIFPPVPLDLEDTSNKTEKIIRNADYIAKTAANRCFPWRCLLIAREDKKLLENNIPYILGEPNVLEDVSWIKPGKVAWEWWHARNIGGVGFKSGFNTETAKYYIDFAAEYNLEYIILDGGWADYLNPVEIKPGVDIREITRYGKEKGVGVILWLLWKPLVNNLDKIFDTYAQWGIAGIKVDFMQRADQLMVDYYEQIAAAGAKRKMLVDYHGAFKPNGLQRKYPNVVGFEGVYGAEMNKFSNKVTPLHDVTIPFIRMLAGPMDYTPGAMINATEKDFKAVNEIPMSLGTRCHQAGMYVVYEAPLQMVSDNPVFYRREPAFTRFLSAIPAVWDETIGLAGKVTEYVVVARRNGNAWYIGGLNNWTPREVEVDLGFLGAGEWSIEYLADGINADRFPTDYLLAQETLKGRKLKISLAAGGGYAAVLKKKF